jgi:hypothetical protein
MRGPGRYVEHGIATEGDLLFWGEWEPPSHAERINAWLPNGPRYVHTPLLPRVSPTGWKQNTDPFVFGSQFHYTGCLQHTKRGPTQLRYLAQGSVVLFGSAFQRSRFMLDTVFVVDHWIDHEERDYRKLRDSIEEGYWRATIEPWYAGDVPPSQSHRLYFGATFDVPFSEMFSFFPCAPAGAIGSGFARPIIDLHEITPTLTQGKRLNPQASVDDLVRLWGDVAGQVEAQGLALGVQAAMPSSTDTAEAHAHDVRMVKC